MLFFIGLINLPLLHLELDCAQPHALHRTSTLFTPGTSLNQYDVNGNLTAITDDTKGENSVGSSLPLPIST